LPARYDALLDQTGEIEQGGHFFSRTMRFTALAHGADE